MERVESLNRQYLRMEVPWDSENGIEGYPSRMLQKNKIPGLLQMDKRFIDGICFHYYEITSMSSLKQLFHKRSMTADHLQTLMGMLEETLESIEAYLLGQENLCLDPEWIMGDAELKQWKFLYIPNYQGNQANDLEQLGEFILDHIDSADEETLERFYDFYCCLQRQGENLTVSGAVRVWRLSGQDRKKEAAERRVGKEKSAALAEASDRVARELPEEMIREYAEELPEETDSQRAYSEKQLERRIGKIYRVPYRG